MENCEVSNHLQDHNYSRHRKISARWAGGVRKPAHSKCPCCTDNQQQPSATTTTANHAQKRKRTSVLPPSKPLVEHPETLNRAPSPQPCTSAAAFAGLLNLGPKPQSTIAPADLPVVSDVAPSPPPSTAPVCPNSPLRIHNRSVEEYQQIYHEVVDDMLTYKNGRTRPYSLELGRRIKQKLWERLNRPTFTTSAGEDGLLRIDMSYGVGVNPPLYDVDISGEPQPKQPPQKRPRN